jgi:hypothetical protein
VVLAAAIHGRVSLSWVLRRLLLQQQCKPAEAMHDYALQLLRPARLDQRITGAQAGWQ